MVVLARCMKPPYRVLQAVILSAVIPASYVGCAVATAAAGRQIERPGFNFQRDERQPVETPFTFKPADPRRWVFNPSRLERYMDAVHRHQPGQPDAGAEAARSWSMQDLADAVKDFESFRKALRRYSSGASLQGSELESMALRLVKMTPEEIFHRDARRVLKRAALLHTDVAVADMSGRLRDDTTSVMAIAPLHFGIAMALIDELGREYPEESVVRAWHIAVAAFLQSQRDVASAPAFLQRAVARFPDNADLAFVAGVVLEFLASPRVQESEVLEIVSHHGRRPAAARDLLKPAEQYLARALSKAPFSIEVRIHHGRVLGELGRREDAAAELAQAARAADTPRVEFLAWLFAGENLAARDQLTAAETAYGSAVVLFPAAASARLALSLLAHRRGDRQAAFAALVPMEPAATANAVDPWDTYFDAGLAAQSGDLLERLRQALKGGGAQ